MRKVDLITGFLGSGKTTFLIKYAKYLMSQGLKIGILEYDYGAVNVDMALLSELRGPMCELEMLAAACDEDCRQRRFKTKLISMAMSGYDRVIVEPSGVFDMDMFYDSLREEPLENWYEIGNVITIVSGDLEENLSKESEYILASQAACAGKILISKTQCVEQEQIQGVKQRIQAGVEEIACRNFSPDYMEKNWEEFTSQEYEEVLHAGYKMANYVKKYSTEQSAFDSISFLQVPEGLDRMKRIIKELFEKDAYGEIVRIKGFVRDGGPSYEINATRAEMNFTKRAGRQVLIVIGRNMQKEKIEQLIQK